MISLLATGATKKHIEMFYGYSVGEYSHLMPSVRTLSKSDIN
jgi:hypothetical protein